MGGQRQLGTATAPGGATTSVPAPSTAPGAFTDPAQHSDGGRLGALVASWGPTGLVAGACVVLLFAWQAAFYADHHPVIDHVAYRAQAEQVLDGDLTLPATKAAPSWALRFTADTDHGRAFKYLPGTAAVGAASLWLTDDVGLALAGSLVLLVAATSGIGGALGWSPGRRALAALLVGASPVVLSNGAVLLSYVPATALLTTATWLVLKATVRSVVDRERGHGVDEPFAPSDEEADPVPTAVDRRSVALVAGAGLVLGAALLVRQLEVVAWAVVLVAWLVLRPGPDRAGRFRQVGALLIGLAPGIAAVLVLHRAITGDAFGFPFTLVSPDDGLGWGWRRVLPGDAFEHFAATDALRTTPRALFDLAMWTLVGPALVVGAGVSTWRRRRSPAHLLLVALAASVPAAFLLHWANAHAVRAGFYMAVGPFYLLPCVPPLVVLGIDGLRRLPRRALVVGLSLALVVQAAFLTGHLWDQWGGGRAPGPSAAAGSAAGPDVHEPVRWH